MTYFRAVYLALSSALPRFTVLFGMGRGGSRALWAPDIACRLVARATKPIREEARVVIAFAWIPWSYCGMQCRINKVIGSSRTGN